MLHLDLILSGYQVLQSPVVDCNLRFGVDNFSGRVAFLLWDVNTISDVVLSLSLNTLCLGLLVELFAVLLVLFTMLSLPTAIGMAYLDSLQLVLDGTNLVLDTKILHLDLVDPNDVFYL